MKWLIVVVLLALGAGAVSVWLGQHEAGGLFGLLAASALGGTAKLKRVGQKAAKEKRREMTHKAIATVAAGSPVAGEHDSARADRHADTERAVDGAAGTVRERNRQAGGRIRSRAESAKRRLRDYAERDGSDDADDVWTRPSRPPSPPSGATPSPRLAAREAEALRLYSEAQAWQTVALIGIPVAVGVGILVGLLIH